MRGLLVGYGSIGRRHLTNLRDLGVDDWALVHTGRGTLPLEPPPAARIYGDLDEALREEAPTFAVIANPTSVHATSAAACLDAGCHVLLEKPVSHSVDDLDRLAEAERVEHRRGARRLPVPLPSGAAEDARARGAGGRRSAAPRRGLLGRVPALVASVGGLAQRLRRRSRARWRRPPHHLPSLRLPAMVVRRRSRWCAQR